MSDCCGSSGDPTGTEEVWSCVDGVGGRGKVLGEDPVALAMVMV